LPKEWEVMLSGNISKDEVLENPDAVIDVLEFQSNIIKQEAQKQKEATAAEAGETALPPERAITLSTPPPRPTHTAHTLIRRGVCGVCVCVRACLCVRRV
jgi:hypothetical protein